MKTYKVPPRVAKAIRNQERDRLKAEHDKLISAITDVSVERDELKAQLALALSDSARKDEQLYSAQYHSDQLANERNALLSERDQAANAVQHLKLAEEKLASLAAERDEARAECEQLKRGLTTAFGIHKDNPVDAVEHQRQLRAEWEDSQGRKPDA